MTSLEQEMGMGLSFKKLGRKIRIKDVSIKNVSKLAVKAAPLVSAGISFIPGGGVASKFLDNGVGRFITKAANSKVGKFVQKAANTKVGKFVVKNGADFAKTALNDVKNKSLSSGGSSASASDAPGSDSEMQDQLVTPADPNEAQQETLNKLNGTPKKDNTLLYAGIGVGVLALGAIAMKSNS